MALIPVEFRKFGTGLKDGAVIQPGIGER